MPRLPVLSVLGANILWKEFTFLSAFVTLFVRLGYQTGDFSFRIMLPKT